MREGRRDRQRDRQRQTERDREGMEGERQEVGGWGVGRGAEGQIFEERRRTVRDRHTDGDRRGEEAETGAKENRRRDMGEEEEKLSYEAKRMEIETKRMRERREMKEG